MEQVLLEQILKHRKEKRVTGNSQHGLTKDKSCLTNLIAFREKKITEFMGKGRAVVFIYLDLSRAFDNVCLSILVSKLGQMVGVGGQPDGLKNMVG